MLQYTAYCYMLSCCRFDYCSGFDSHLFCFPLHCAAADSDTGRPYNYNSIMHYSAGSEISTPANGGIQTGRRTGGLDGNDVSQFRQIYECNPEFADTPTAIALVGGYACPAGATLKSDSTDVQLCAAAARTANCSVIQFSSPECKCCDRLARLPALDSSSRLPALDSSSRLPALDSSWEYACQR